MEIFNKDVSILGDLTLSTTNATGNFLTLDGTAVAKFRTPGEVLIDISAAPLVHTHVIADITDFTDNSVNWDLAFGWGDHSLAGYEEVANKGAANGYVPLDSGSKIPNTYLPALAITETFVVASQAAMLLLTTAETGDVAVRTDENKTYILQGTDYATLGDWQEMLTPTDSVASVNGLTGVVTLDLSWVSGTGNLSITGGNTVNLDGRYSLLGHTHTESDITDLQPYLLAADLANYVDKTSAEDVGGVKTFTSDSYWGGLTGTRIRMVESVASMEAHDASSNWTAIRPTQILMHNATGNRTIFISNPASTTGNHTQTLQNKAGTFAYLDDIFSPTNLLTDYSFTDNSANWNTAFGWGDHDGLYVGLTGNETVAGIKTFSSFSLTPSSAPTTDYQVANKKYVDDEIAGAGGYNDEQAQDAVGTILVDSSEIDFTYNDITPSITASIVTGSIDILKLDSGVQTTLNNADTAFSWGDHSGLYSLLAHTHTFASLTSKPTTLSGYGISDTKVNFNSALSDGTFIFEGDSRLTDARTPLSHTLLSHTISGETAGHVLAADSATTYSIRQLLGSEINNDLGWATSASVSITDNHVAVGTGSGIEGNAGFLYNSVTNTMTLGVNTTSTTVPSIVLSQAGVGDVFQTWTSDGASWSVGIDSSATDNFFISRGTDLTSDIVLEFGDVGNEMYFRGTSMYHFTNRSSDYTGLYLQNAGTGDIRINYNAGGVDWTTGIDQSDTEAFKIQLGSNPSIGSTALRIDSVTMDTLFAGSMSIYDAVNDANPSWSLGSSATERLEIVSNYVSASQSLDYVNFKTYTASGTANRGLFRFSVDEVDVFDIFDDGIHLAANKQILGTDSGGTDRTLFYLDGSDVLHVLNNALGTGGDIRIRTKAAGGTTATFTNAGDLDLVGNLIVGESVYKNNVATASGAILYPDGAYYRTAVNSHTGAFKIALPIAVSDVNVSDMISFEVKIFDYSSNESVHLFISAYNYQNFAGTEWLNPSVQVITSAGVDAKLYTVRFGQDGTRKCIWIGETNSAWNYPQLQVMNFTGGFNTDVTAYTDDWVVTANEISFGTVIETASSTAPYVGDFLHAAEADIKTAGNLTFNDNVRIELGTSALGGEIFYNGVDNYWKVKLGDLIIQDNSTTRFTFGRTTGTLTATGDFIAQGGQVTATGTSIDVSMDVNKGFNIEANAATGGWARGVRFEDNGVTTGGIGGLGVAGGALTHISIAANPTGNWWDTAEGITLTTDTFKIFDTVFNIDSAGNVGIGTTAPQELLHVAAADGVEGKLKIEGGKSTVTAIGEVNSSLLFGSNDGSVNGTGIGANQVAGKIASITESTNGALVGMGFYTFDQGRADTTELKEAMRITNKGDIGIGVSSITSINSSATLFASADPKMEIIVGTGSDVSYDDLVVLRHSGTGSTVQTRRAGIKMALSSESSTGESNKMAAIYAESTSSWANNTYLCLATNNVERLRVQTQGIVEILGRTGEQLRLNDTATNGNPYMSFYQSGTRRSFVQHVDGGDILSLVSEYGDVRIMTGSAGTEVEQFRVKSTGAIQLFDYGEATAQNTGTYKRSLEVDASGNIIEADRFSVDTPASSATHTLDYNDGPNMFVTLTANTTFTLSNVPDGGVGTILVLQDGTGGRTTTIGGIVSTYDVVIGSETDVDTTANTYSTITYKRFGSRYTYIYGHGDTGSFNAAP